MLFARKSVYALGSVVTVSRVSSPPMLSIKSHRTLEIETTNGNVSGCGD